MKNKFLLATSVFILAIGISSNAQPVELTGANKNITIREIQLPQEGEGTESLRMEISSVPGDILYGPHNQAATNRTVVVFVHGKGDDPTKWYNANYSVPNDWNTYMKNNNFRHCYVALHPDENFLTNGQLLTSMLNTICTHYNSQRVVVVAHSKGGLDTDAAVNIYGSQKVAKVITLSSPHWGSSMADLPYSNIPSYVSFSNKLSTLLRIFFWSQQNNATYCLQTAVCAEYRRGTAGYVYSGIDLKGTTGDVPFVTFAATGFKSNAGSYSVRAQCIIGGSLLYGFNGSNDALVGRNYAKRSADNTTNMTTSFSKFNHNDIRSCGNIRNVSSYVKANIPTNGISRISEQENPILNELTEENLRELDEFPGTNDGGMPGKYSNLQMYYDLDKQFKFHVSKNTTKVSLSVYRKAIEPVEIFKIVNRQLTPVVFREEGSENHILIELNSPEEGDYLIQSSDDIAPFIVFEGAPTLNLTNDEGFFNPTKIHVGETNNLRLHLTENRDGVTITSATARIARVGSFISEERRGAEKRFVFAKNDDGTVTGQLSGLTEEGIYSMSIWAVYSDGSERTLVTSIGVTPNRTQANRNASVSDGIHVYPNPATTQLTLNLASDMESVITVTDISGRKVLSEISTSTMHTLNIENLEKGHYVITVENVNGKTATSFIK